MKKIIIVLSLLLGLATCIRAQSTVEKQIAAQVENLRSAMIAADKNTLDRLTAPELSYGHSNGLVENKAAFINDFINGKSVFKTITLSEQSIRLAGEVALVRHRLTGNTNNDNVPGRVDLLVLLIWQKQNGQWKLLARQAVKSLNQPN